MTKKRTIWQEPKKNYYRVPCKLFTLGLSYGEIAVYSYLLSLMDKETGKCHPSYTTIGERLGMTKNTVKKYVDMLEKRDLIMTEHTIIRTKKGKIHNGNLEYTVLDVQDMIDMHNQKEADRSVREEEKRKILERAKKLGVTIIPHDESA